MIESIGAGLYQVSGPLSYATAAGVAERAAAVIRAGQTVTFDLAGVQAVDSAALALVVEWLRVGHSRGVEVRLRSVPEALRDLARVYGCDELLPELAAP